MVGNRQPVIAGMALRSFDPLCRSRYTATTLTTAINLTIATLRTASWLERLLFKQEVHGSSPSSPPRGCNKPSFRLVPQVGWGNACVAAFNALER